MPCRWVVVALDFLWGLAPRPNPTPPPNALTCAVLRPPSGGPPGTVGLGLPLDGCPANKLLRVAERLLQGPRACGHQNKLKKKNQRGAREIKAELRVQDHTPWGVLPSAAF